MSAPTQQPGAVQSDASGQNGQPPEQGGTQQDRGRSESRLIDTSLLDNAPQELRPHIEEFLTQHVEPSLAERLQGADQLRETWEPYSEIQGLTDLDPSDVDDLVGFADMIAGADSGDEQAKEALEQTWEELGNRFGFFDDDDEGGDDPAGVSPEDDRIARLEQELQELRQGTQQSQQERHVEKTQQELRSLVGGLDLPGDPGSEDRQEAEQAIWTFIMRYGNEGDMSNEQAVKAAYQDYQRLTGRAQAQQITDASRQGGGRTVNGGSSASAPEPITSFKEASRIARERLGAG